MTVRGRVEGGVVKLDQPLPEGSVVAVQVVEDVLVDDDGNEYGAVGADLDPDDRAELLACLERGHQAAAEGRTRPLAEAKQLQRRLLDERRRARR